MIEFVKGNLFMCKAEALVNPVNCVGVSGAGLAKKFKEFFPDNYKAYHAYCCERKLTLGSVHAYQYCKSGLFGTFTVFNFPTKNYPSDRSDLNSIRWGLDILLAKLNLLEIKSVGIPALGCGLGGLAWKDVSVLIQERLKDFKGTVYVYKPQNRKR